MTGGIQRIISIFCLIALGMFDISSGWSATPLPPGINPNQNPAGKPPSANRPLTFEERLSKVEQVVNGQTLVDIVFRLQELQKEVTQVRGQMEELSHNINGVKQRERDLYQDVDKRLQVLEQALSGGGGQLSVAPTANSPGGGGGAANAQAAYQDAFNLLKTGKHDQALAAFKHYLALYPKSEFAHNAQYWLGEINFVNRNYKEAIQEFQKVVSQYPESAKIPDALLKQGYSYYEIKEWDNAKRVLQEIKNRYQQSTAANLADKRLQKMAKEGR